MKTIAYSSGGSNDTFKYNGDGQRVEKVENGTNRASSMTVRARLRTTSLRGLAGWRGPRSAITVRTVLVPM